MEKCKNERGIYKLELTEQQKPDGNQKNHIERKHTQKKKEKKIR